MVSGAGESVLGFQTEGNSYFNGFSLNPVLFRMLGMKENHIFAFKSSVNKRSNCLLNCAYDCTVNLLLSTGLLVNYQAPIEKTQQNDVLSAVSELPVVLIERDKDQPNMHRKCNSMFHRHCPVFINRLFDEI